MKRIINIIITLTFCICVFSQRAAYKLSNSSTVATASVMDCPTWVYFWGLSTVDTLGASDTLTQIVRVDGLGLLNIKPLINMVKVSGTVTNNCFISASVDGTTWTGIDTVAYSNSATLSQELTDSDFSNFNWKYLKFQLISGATAQKAWYKVTLLSRY